MNYRQKKRQIKNKIIDFLMILLLLTAVGIIVVIL